MFTSRASCDRTQLSRVQGLIYDREGKTTGFLHDNDNEKKVRLLVITETEVSEKGMHSLENP